MGDHNRLHFEQEGMPPFDVGFMRTLRIPDDGKEYPLPPSLGTFPLRRASDYADKVPSSWLDGEVFFVPVTQREAMWLSLASPHWDPHAVKVAKGRVNALSGKPWNEALVEAEPPDYLVFPEQAWLDRFNPGSGSLRQFVASPLRSVGVDVAEKEEHCGLRLVVYPPKPGRFHSTPPRPARAHPPGFRFAINDAKALEKVTRDLVNQGAITEEQLRNARHSAEERSDGILMALLDRNLVDQSVLEEMAAKANASVLGIGYRDLKNLDPELWRLIPEPFAHRYKCVGIAQNSESNITLAMVDPMDLVALDDIALITGYQVEVVQASFSAIAAAYCYLYGVTSIVDLGGTEFLEPPPRNQSGERYALDTWDVENRACVDVHLVDIDSWARITGEAAPVTPVNAVLYRNHGYPWLEIYGDDLTVAT
jgi:hypothetical protein